MNMRIMLLMLSVLIVGCGSGSDLATVEGTVTLDGKPVKGASVSFEPVGKSPSDNVGGGSYGVTDEQGHYKLKTVLDDSDGAAVGEHRVKISIATAAKDDMDIPIPGAMSDKLHPNYSTQSKLTFTVPPDGTEEADFALTKNGALPK